LLDSLLQESLFTRMVGKVAIIGAGPSGNAVLCWFAKRKEEGQAIPDLVCFEKASDWGGLWKYNWRTGTDEFGEQVHGSQYRFLWMNSPKETIEYPGYTFEDHFGKPIPSFPPRDVVFDYLKGRWTQQEIRKYIKFRHVVRHVQYNEATDDFTVSVKDLENDKVLDSERFDYVIVASGHYSVPNIPSFQGIDKFPGRVMHSHDFRDAREFSSSRVLLIGSHYSAEDLALQLIKYGANKITCTWRTKPMEFKWPSQIEEKPLVQRFEGGVAHFKDGSSQEFDAVIMCTGYLHSYPFLREELRLKSKNVLYPAGLYKGIVWTAGGNNKLLYAGTQDNYYTFSMFDVMGLWMVKLIQGEIKLPSTEIMDEDWGRWVAREKQKKGYSDEVALQTDYVVDLVGECGAEYPYDLDVSEMLHEWLGHKKDDLVTYRDQSFACKFTGTKNPAHHTTFMKAFDDSLETFLRNSA